MLAISVRLLHGTIRAGRADDIALTGAESVGEWPPSPARLFSALVAADGTGQRCTVTTGAELDFLERLDPPVIVADPAPVTTHLVDRYVVRDQTDDELVQEYPARRATLVHPGVRLSPRDPTVTYVWDTDVEPTVVDDLRRRSARVGYFGCADSPAQVRVSILDAPPKGPMWRPVDAGGVTLPVPYDGFVHALDVAFDRWSGGAAAHSSWIRKQWQRYARADRELGAEEPTVLWLRFDRPVIGRHVRIVTETLRQAIIEHLSRRLGDDQVPWQVHGHNIPGDVASPYQLVRFLALPDVGYRHSDGRIRGAAIWLPVDLNAASIEAIRAVVWDLRRLHRPGWFDVGVAPHDGSPKPWTVNPLRWVNEAVEYASVLPVVHERFTKKTPDLAEVGRWFVHAGYPAPIHAQVLPVPELDGAVWLRPHEVHRRRQDRHPYSWIRVRFATPVRGPVCVGRSRSFGLGLLAPITDRRR